MQTFSIDKNFDCVMLDRDFEIVNLCGKYKKEGIWFRFFYRNQFKEVFTGTYPRKPEPNAFSVLVLRV